MGKTDIPIIDRMFVFASLNYSNVRGVSNKFWNIKVYDLGGSYRMVVSFGKVGGKQQTREKIIYNLNEAHKKIAFQQKEGYKEVFRKVERVKVVVEDDENASNVSPKIVSFVNSLLSKTEQNIQSYLDVAVSDLSLSQIQLGRDIISRLNNIKNNGNRTEILRLVENFLTTIPTKIAKYDPDYICRQILDNLPAQEDRLNQLEAAVNANNSTKTIKIKNTLFSKLGAEVSEISPDDNDIQEILDLFKKTLDGKRAKVLDVFSLYNETVRKRYNENTFGKEHEGYFFHGTRPQFFRHIAAQGLRIPSVTLNGRLFGDGIYFADQSAKAHTYATYERFNGNQHIILVSKVAFGKKHIVTSSYHGHSAPQGYHSVYASSGKVFGSWSGFLRYNELVVFKEKQADLNYVIVFES